MGTRKAVTVKPPAAEVEKTPRAKKATATPPAADKPQRKKAGAPKGAAKPKPRNPLRKNTPKGAKAEPLAAVVPVPPTLAEELGLDLRDALFADIYLTHFNASRAYREAGFESKSDGASSVAASRLMRRPNVAEYLRRRGKAMVERVEDEQGKLMTVLTYTAYADPNELVEHRLDCCRFCYGENNEYQFTPQEYVRYQEDFDRQVAEAQANKEPEPVFDSKGGVGFNPNHDPNPDCPECFGRGKPSVLFKDTRYLSPSALALYASTELTKDGMKIKTNSQDKARDTLAKIHKLYDDNTKVEFSFDAATLDEQFAKKMAASHLRMKEMRADREKDD